MADVHIRWMIRKDLHSVLAIEEESHVEPWTENEFIRHLRQQTTIGMIADLGDNIVGFMVYQLHKNRIEVLNFAVAGSFRRRGVGSAMVEKLRGKLGQTRNRIQLTIPETSLDGQLFFRACGFTAVSVLKDFYDTSDEDAYVMQFKVKSEVLEKSRGK